jgi:bifunctional UDP-N-acetylglucosamine pyrophosphorylase/glucosamine-1-phosphate N-acetyltransferase
LDGGATLTAPETVFLAWDTALGPDTEVAPHVVFGPGVVVEGPAQIRAFSHLEGCHVAAGAIIGPYARLRPGAAVGEGAHVGNFVELKAASLGAGAKVNHLSYIGDATVGAGTNIGAGTITCNYDGFAKHRTDIGERVFVGSDSVLVAPVRLGDGSFVAAGSVITKDVAPDAMAFGRARQADVAGGGAAFREARQKKKDVLF